VLRWARSQQIPVSLFGTLLGCSIAASLAAGYRPHGLREQASSLLPTWTVLALALLIAFQTFFINLTMPAQTIGVFLRCSFRIVSHDVSIYLALSIIFFFAYGFTTYVAYPRIGSHTLPYFPNFNDIVSALHEIVELSLFSDPSTFQLPGGSPTDAKQEYDIIVSALTGTGVGPVWPASPDLPALECIEVAVFVAFYLTYAMLSCVLLLNLLIAMMSHTFISAQESAQLEWRVLYARNILRLEMVAEIFAAWGWVDIHGGERGADGKYYVFNRVHDQKAYGANQDGDELQEVGLFGASTRSGADSLSVKAYASAIGVDATEMDAAAAQVQEIYRKRRRLMGGWSASAGEGSPPGSPGPTSTRATSERSKQRSRRASAHPSLKSAPSPSPPQEATVEPMSLTPSVTNGANGAQAARMVAKSVPMPSALPKPDLAC